MTVQRCVKYFFAPNSSDIPEKWWRKKKKRGTYEVRSFLRFKKTQKKYFVCRLKIKDKYMHVTTEHVQHFIYLFKVGSHCR